MITISNDAETLVKQIGIPSQPKVVLEIYREFKKKEPDFKVISDLVAKDASLSAKVIKVINSPFYGVPRRVTSIQQAVTMLGLKNFFRVVLTASLREVLAAGSQDKRLEMLWRHTVTVAKSAEFIATWLNASISPEDAYMAGLFHDCAIPVLIKKFQIADTYFGGDRPAGELIRREEAACGTNHALVGGIMAKSWGMTREISQSIKYHHVTSLREIDDDTCHSMWFIVRVADFVAERVFWGGGLDNYEYFINELDTSSGYLNSMQIDQYTLEKIGVSGQMLNELINDMNDFITLDDVDL